MDSEKLLSLLITEYDNRKSLKKYNGEPRKFTWYDIKSLTSSVTDNLKKLEGTVDILVRDDLLDVDHQIGNDFFLDGDNLLKYENTNVILRNNIIKSRSNRFSKKIERWDNDLDMRKTLFKFVFSTFAGWVIGLISQHYFDIAGWFLDIIS